MSMMKKLGLWFIAMLAGATLLAAYAQGPVIDQAKAQGIVGEQFDGYLGIVDPSRASADVKRRVQGVNAGRLAEYTRISNEKGDSVATVAAAMAEKQFARAAPGEMLKPGPEAPWQKN